MNSNKQLFKHANFGYVDTFDKGENLMYTFDITTSFTIILIKDGKFSIFPRYENYGTSFIDLYNFLLGKYEGVISYSVRPRVKGV